MIYVLETYCDLSEHCTVDSVWECDVDVEEFKRQFFLDAAEKRGITINPHHFNMMNRADYNYHLSKEEFDKAEVEWCSYQNFWTTKRFLVGVLKAKQIEYERLL